jgi:RimJ/RimL family protein N-acetyltransferase
VAQRSFTTIVEKRGKPRLIWVIQDRDSRHPRGILGVSPDGKQAEVGVMLLPEAQARGFAEEAISAIADQLFLDSRFQCLWTRHASENRAAHVLMQKMAFELRRDDGQAPGEVRWQLTRQAWGSRKRAVAVAAFSR